VFERPAPINHPIHELLTRRWSTRAFTDQPVTDEDVARLFEAARWAPSSGNGQPWSFIVAQRKQTEEFEKLASVLNSGNSWARAGGVLILAVATLDRSPGNANRHAWFDVGLASENIALQACAMRLGFHMMAGFNAEKASEVLEIPERYAPVAMMVVGHPAHPDTLEESLRDKDMKPRHRKPFSEFVFTGKWGVSEPLV
jgi:nitroreductase